MFLKSFNGYVVMWNCEFNTSKEKVNKSSIDQCSVQNLWRVGEKKGKWKKKSERKILVWVETPFCHFLSFIFSLKPNNGNKFTNLEVNILLKYKNRWNIWRFWIPFFIGRYVFVLAKFGILHFLNFVPAQIQVGTGHIGQYRTRSKLDFLFK